MHSCLDVTLGSKGIILALPESACCKREPSVRKRVEGDFVNSDEPAASWWVFWYLKFADG